MNKLNPYQYARAVVETHSEEKKMLTKDTMERMLTEKNIEFILQELRRAGYFNETDIRLTKHNYDELLMESVEEFASVFSINQPKYEFLDMFFLEFDIYNIKSILMKRDKDLNYPARVLNIPKLRAVHYKKISEGFLPMYATKYDDLFWKAKAVYEEKGSKELQEYLDETFFDMLLKLARDSGIPMFLAYAQSKIDFYNLMFFLRSIKIWETIGNPPKEKALKIIESKLIKGGHIANYDIISLANMSQIQIQEFFENSFYGTSLEEGIRIYGYDKDLSILEKCMDNYLIGLCREHQFTSVGPEPIFGYLLGRRYEIINIRLILTSLFLKVPEEIVKERLRDTYV